MLTILRTVTEQLPGMLMVLSSTPVLGREGQDQNRFFFNKQYKNTEKKTQEARV